MPAQYPGNTINKAARSKAGGGFESAIEVAAGGGASSALIEIDFTLDQSQAIFAALNVAAVPAGSIWASALAPDQPDGSLTQDGSQGNPYSMRRAIYSAGPNDQVILKDDGVYTLDFTLQTDSQYSETNYIGQSTVPWNMTSPNSAAERILIRGEPGTCPVIDATNVGTAIDISMNWLELAYFRVNNAANAINVGSTADYGGPCQGTKIHHVCGEFFRQIGAGSNVAFIGLHADAAAGDKPEIDACVIRGNSSTSNQNNACIYVTQANKWSVTRCYLYGVQFHVVYFKHGNDYVTAGGSGTVDITFENNFCDGNVSWAGSYTNFRNNVLTGSLFVKADGGGQEIDQDSNSIHNNTLLGDIELSRLDWNCNNNDLKDNVCAAIKIQTGGDGTAPLDPSTNSNASDYNLINGADDGQRFLWESAYSTPPQYKTLADWRAYLGIDLNSQVAANQLVGAGTYAAFSDYYLASGSVGIGASSIGGNIGANVSAVGVQ